MSREFYESYGLDYKLTLISPASGNSLVINLLVIELNMFEDMFGPFMRMEVTLNDAMGLLDKFPLVGDEILDFRYKNPNDQELSQTFQVYRVTNRQGIKARQQVFSIHAISEPGFRNTFEYVYKPYIEKNTKAIPTTLFIAVRGNVFAWYILITM